MNALRQKEPNAGHMRLLSENRKFIKPCEGTTMKSQARLFSVIMLSSAMSALATTSFAADSSSDERISGFFIGAHYGQYSSDGEEFDDDNDFYDVIIGGLINPYIGVEGGYSDLGTIGGNVASADLYGYHIAGLLRMPIGKSFGIYAKGGQFFWKSEVEALGFAEDLDGDEPFYGVGVDFAFNQHVSMDVEYLRYKVDLDDSNLPDLVDDYETDIDTAKVGLKVFF